MHCLAESMAKIGRKRSTDFDRIGGNTLLFTLMHTVDIMNGFMNECSVSKTFPAWNFHHECDKKLFLRSAKE